MLSTWLYIIERAIVLSKPSAVQSGTHRPITIERNLNAVTLCGGESLPVSSLTINPQLAPKPHFYTNIERTSKY